MLAGLMLRLARAGRAAAARRTPALSLLLLAAAAAAAAALAAAPPAHAQGAADGEDVGPSPSDLVLLFAVSIAAVAGIALYISREAIARKKTPYDRGSYESQRNRDYEKYHSGWGDESAAGRGAGGLDDDDGDDFDDDFGGGAAGGRAPDYYGVLGLGRDAGPGEVKQRYRELAKEAHPDRAGSAPGGGDAVRRMALINEAYEVLSDPDRRKRYDLRFGRRGGGGGGGNGGGGGET